MSERERDRERETERETERQIDRPTEKKRDRLWIRFIHPITDHCLRFLYFVDTLLSPPRDNIVDITPMDGL